MAQVKTLDICKVDLFTDREKLLTKYDEQRVEHIERLRSMYEWFLQNPEKKDRQFIDQFRASTNLSNSCLYADLAIIKALLPLLGQATRDFHRFRYNEMILETYQMAKARKDTKTMEKAASSYAKYNRIDLEDEKDLPYELIVIQPFTATEDPSILGVKPLPNRDEVISRLLRKYGADNPDIEDVEAEEADLEEKELFPVVNNEEED